MPKLPHLYRKLAALAKQIADYDLNQEIPRGGLREVIPRRFRLTSKDVDITMRELEQRNRISEQMKDRRRARFPHR